MTGTTLTLLVSGPFAGKPISPPLVQPCGRSLLKHLDFMPQSFSYFITHSSDEMEADRAETNLGDSVNTDYAIQGESKPKQPKKRFVGRKTAEKTERANGGLNGTIEDSGKLQGILGPS